VLVSVGNTRTRIARVIDRALQPSEVLPSADAHAVADRIRAAAGPEADESPTVVVASVNDPAADALEAALGSAGVRVLRFGRDLNIPIAAAVESPQAVGQDRLLDALGAFARSSQACIVVDAGTAITVDFVDGQGVFQGGAIAPGVQMMLDALHDKTAALPSLRLSPDLLPAAHNPSEPDAASDASEDEDAPPGPAPFGKNTSQAMIIGSVAAARGLVRHLVDAYAEFYRAYPRVVATGGDAPLLFASDPIVEAIVPDLTLVGMLEAVRLLESLDDADDAGEPDEDRGT
jgi:type III pantothenate kinase